MRRPRARALLAIGGLVAAALFATVVAQSRPPAAGAVAPGDAVATGATFPVSVQSGGGTVHIAAKPQRVLCLSASATQMLYAIGAGSQVVGVDKYSTYPSNAPRTQFTGYETSAESYVRLKPDLIILAFSTGPMLQQLKVLGIPALVLSPATSFPNVDSQLAELGTATGHEAAAREVEASLATDIAAQVHRAGPAGRGKTYYIELDPTFYSATSATFIGAEFSLFGMHDIADAAGHGSAYPQISAEYILKENPDYVFLADTVCCHVNATNFGQRPGFSVLQAVRLHHVVGVNDSDASQWGPHTIEAFVSLLATTLRS